LGISKCRCRLQALKPSTRQKTSLRVDDNVEKKKRTMLLCVSSAFCAKNKKAEKRALCGYMQNWKGSVAARAATPTGLCFVLFFSGVLRIPFRPSYRSVRVVSHPRN
jgi:hypothetical protein